MSQSSSPFVTQAWLLFSNVAMMIGWIRVAIVVSQHWFSFVGEEPASVPSDFCSDKMVPVVMMALKISFLELLSCIVGFTRSKPSQVLLFCSIRTGTEIIVAPALTTCSAWQHMLTVTLWSFGDAIRFFCFALDIVLPQGNLLAKRIRYTVGPILFPFGALGEMLMVIDVGNRTTDLVPKLAIYGAASLWPVGFYFLYTQLLRQRKKFFSDLDKKEPVEKSV